MQPATARDQYLFTNVNTATPQKLQSLLIDAALQSAHRAEEYWRQGHDDKAVVALVHAQNVLNEMLGAIDHNAAGELALRVSAVYDFIFHALVRASAQHDEKSLVEAVRVLEIERETWRLVCERAATDQAPPAAPHFRFGAPTDAVVGDFAGGLSLEA
jgi:flagellar secretion chaperone FliS